MTERLLPSRNLEKGRNTEAVRTSVFAGPQDLRAVQAVLRVNGPFYERDDGSDLTQS